MRKINCFLASSINEFKDQRRKIGDFINNLNNLLIEDDIYIHMLQCEYATDEIEKNRKQESYNEFIRTSDFCLLLAGSFIGAYTMEEYFVSKETFNKRDDFFFDIEIFNSDENEEVHKFVEQVDNDQLTYKIFNDVDDLYLAILMNLKLLGLEVECVDSYITINGNKVLNIANIEILKEKNSFETLHKINQKILEHDLTYRPQLAYFELFGKNPSRALRILNQKIEDTDWEGGCVVD